jgi:hypothetical protein
LKRAALRPTCRSTTATCSCSPPLWRYRPTAAPLAPLQARCTRPCPATRGSPLNLKDSMSTTKDSQGDRPNPVYPFCAGATSTLTTSQHLPHACGPRSLPTRAKRIPTYSEKSLLCGWSCRTQGMYETAMRTADDADATASLLAARFGRWDSPALRTTSQAADPPYVRFAAAYVRLLALAAAPGWFGKCPSALQSLASRIHTAVLCPAPSLLPV